MASVTADRTLGGKKKKEEEEEKKQKQSTSTSPSEKTEPVGTTSTGSKSISTEGWADWAEQNDNKISTENWSLWAEQGPYLRTLQTGLDNATWMPKNTHMQELNQNMIDQGLHPIFTDDTRYKPYYGQIIPDGNIDSYIKAAEDEYYRRNEALQNVESAWANGSDLSYDEYESRLGNAQRGVRDIQQEISSLRNYKENQWLNDLPKDVQGILNDLAVAHDNYDSVVAYRSGSPKANQGFETGRPSWSEDLDEPSEAIRSARLKLKNMGYSDEEIDRMYNAYKNIYNDKLADEWKQIFQSAATKLPILTSAGSVVSSLIGGVTGLAGAIVHPGERNNPVFQGLNQFSSTTQDTVRTNIEESVRSKISDPSSAGFWSKLAGFGYAATTSAIQSALAMGTGAVLGVPILGEAILGAGAASQQYNDLLNNGFSAEDAMLGGFVSGAIETLTEHVSLEKLRWLQASGQGLKNLPLNLVKQFITEGSEEIASDILNEAWDYYAHGGLSKYYQFITKYLDEHRGATEAEARTAYAKDFGRQLLESGVIGGLSGAMGAGRVGVQNTFVNRQNDLYAGRAFQADRALNGQDAYLAALDAAYNLGEDSKARQNLVNMGQSFINAEGETQSRRETRKQGAAINSILSELNETPGGKAVAKSYQERFDNLYGNAVNRAILRKYGVDEKTVDPNSDEALMKTAQKLGLDSKTTENLLNIIDSESSTPKLQQLVGLEEALRYGKAGIDLTSGSFADALTNVQRETAAAIGRNLTAAEVEQRQQTLDKAYSEMVKSENVRINGKVQTVSYVGELSYKALNETQKPQVDYITEFAKQVGRNRVVFYASKLAEDGKTRVFSTKTWNYEAGTAAPNAFYNHATGDVYVDINAGDGGQGYMLFHAAHEYGHHIAQYAPAKFQKMLDYLTHEVYGGETTRELINAQILKAGGNMSVREASIEVFCDAMQEMFTQGNIEERLAKLKGEDRSLWQQFKDFVSKLLADIKAIYKKVQPESEEARLLKQNMDAFEKLADMFTEASVEAGRVFEAMSADQQEMAIQTGEVNPEGEMSGHSHSLRSYAVCCGYDIAEVDGIYQVVNKRTGKPVKTVSEDVIKDSPLGNIIDVAVRQGNLSQDDADKQYEMLAELLDMCVRYKDFSIPWEIAGSVMFSAIKANSDAQYGRTIDFSTICKKTQSIINVMSRVMLDLGRGLTAKEVREEVYKAVGEAGEPTPCPVCYVFSRWMGIGGILQNIYDFQLKYNNASKADVMNLIDSTERRLRAFADQKGKSDYFDADGNYKYGKIISEMKTKPDGKVKRAQKAIDAHYNALETIAFVQDRLAKSDLSDAKKKEYNDTLKAAKKKVLSDKTFAAKEAAIEAGRRELKPLEEYQFIKNTRFNSDGTYNEDYVPVKGENGKTAEQVLASVLFDLNNAEGLATKYPALWRYRSTRGCNAGKAILPYSDMWTGEVIQGIVGDISDIQRGEGNPFLNGDTDEQQSLIDRAIKKTAAQNLIGGMRFQSTSDFRYEYGSDYLMAFLELQAIGSNVQLYTKVIEGVDMFASMGADINLSLMPENDGFKIDENGNRVLAFSKVTGIHPDGAFKMISKYDNVQAILVGISDEHITAAMADGRIGFIIPFHGSGNTVKVIADLMKLLNQSLDITKARDYSAVQNDRERAASTYDPKSKHYINGNKALYEQHKRLRELRMMILTGNDGQKKATFKDADLAMIRENPYLSDLYARMWVDEDSAEYGVRLSKAQAEKIFPFEYWDKNLTLAEADENGRRFVEYCESLGLFPRFSGVTEANGNRGDYGNLTQKTGYWKLLIDRPMYDLHGNYREQQKINATSMKTEYLLPSWGTDNYAEYMQSDSTKDMDKVDEIAKKVEANLVPDASLNARSSGNISATEFESDSAMQEYVGGVSNSLRITDQTEIDRLDAEPKLKLYRSLIEINGKFYSPMSTFDANGKLRNPYEFGAWYRSVEDPDHAYPVTLKNGKVKYKFDLFKGGQNEKFKKTNALPAVDYNPYEHQTDSMFNDQFTGAYSRPNLVLVEFEVPASEDSVKYRAPKAALTTGWNSWHAGPVASKIKKAGGPERKLFLSRWVKLSRIVPIEEVAQNYKENLSIAGIAMPDNLVPPNLLKALIEIGVPIEKSGKVVYNDDGMPIGWRDGKKVVPNGIDYSATQGAKVSLSGRNGLENGFVTDYNNYVTHSGEKLRFTDPSLYPDSDREWSIFARSFANKTSGMAAGETRSFDIYSADYRYVLVADGYMQGTIIDKVSLDENDEIEEAFINDIYKEPNFVDGSIERSRSGQGDSDSDSNLLEKRQPDYLVSELDQFIASHPQFYGDRSKSGGNRYRRFEEKVQRGINDASLTEERIDYLIADNGAGARTDYARGWVTSISPTDFLNLTLNKLKDRTKFDAAKTEYGNTMENYDYMSELKSNVRETPYLSVDVETGKVLGHEGRHRMRALEKAGVKSVPIKIEFRDENGYVVKEKNGYGKELKNLIFLQLENQYDTGDSAVVFDVIPLMKSKKNEILQMYGNKDAAISFSARNTDAADARTLLSNALLETAQTDAERDLLERYQAKIGDRNKDDVRLGKIRDQIREMMFAKGPRDAAYKEKLAKLNAQAKILSDRIARADKKLLEMESTKPLKNVVLNETKKAAEKARTKGYEAAETKFRRKIERLEADIEHRKEMRQKGIDQRASTDLRTNIKKIRKEFIEKFRKDDTIPPALVEGVIDVCNMIDPTGEDQETKAAQGYRDMRARLIELKAAYESLRTNDKIDYDFKSEFSQELSDRIGVLADAIGNKPLREMNRAQLEDVYAALVEIRHTLANAKKQLGKENAITNYQAGMGFVRTMQTVKDKKLNKGPAAGKVSDALRNWMTNPIRAVREMAGFDKESELVKSFEDIPAGFFKGQFWAMRAKKIMEPFTTGENRSLYIDASTKAHDFGLKDLDGNDLKISKMQAMQILLTYERETNNENRAHLANTIIIPDVDYIAKGQYAKALDHSQKLAALDADTVQKLRDGLDTEFDKGVMEAARTIFKMASDAVNETSLILKGRAIATEKFYIPYEVFGDVLNNEFENVAYDIAIANMGMTKSVQPNSTASLVIRGLDTVLNKHVDDTAKYYGLAIPVRNFTKAYNTKLTAVDAAENGVVSAKNAIRDAWGADAMKLIEKSVADVQGSRPGDRIAVLDAIRSAWVSATLAGNISVWMKQAASYPTAGSILSAGSLFKGLSYLKTDTSKKAREALWEEIDEHTALHYMRRIGLSTQELGDFSQSKGLLKRASDRLGHLSPMNWIQAMDVRTTAALWVACKAQARKDGYKAGTDGYWEHVTELYQQVLEETQPMYDPLHRAEITKNKAQHFIMFQTQPIQNSGILRSATMELRDARKVYGKDSQQAKAAGKKFLKATSSQLASHMIFALMTAIAAGALHKMNPWRDDDDELTLESVLGKYAKDVGSAYFGAVLPVFGSYIVSILERVIGGSRYDVLSEPVVDRINTTISNLQRLTNPSVDNVISAITDVLSYTGVPAGNLYNIVNGIRMHVTDMLDGKFLSFEAGVDRTTAQQRSRLYKALLNGDEALVSELRKEAFPDEKTYHTAIQTALKDNEARLVDAVTALEADDLTEYRRILEEIEAEGIFSLEDITAAARSMDGTFDGHVKNAKAAELSGDDETYRKNLNALLDAGYDEDFVLQRIAEYEPEEEDPYSQEVQWLSSSDAKAFLYKAIKAGDTANVNFLKQQYETEDKFHNAVRAALRENDPRIRQAAEARLKGDTARYVQIVKAIVGERRFSQDDVIKAVNSESQSLKKEIESTAPTNTTPWWEDESDGDYDDSYGFKRADLGNAFLTGDETNIGAVIDDLVDDKLDDGVDQEAAEKSAASTVKTSLKTLYVEGSLDQAKTTEYLKTYTDLEDDDIYWTFREWGYAKDHGGSSDGYGKYNDFYSAVETGKDLKNVIRDYLTHGVKASTVASQITSHYKPLYLQMSNSERAALKARLLNAYTLLGYNYYSKSKDIDKWLTQ